MTYQEMLVRAFEIALDSPDPSSQNGAFILAQRVESSQSEGLMVFDADPIKATEACNTFPERVSQDYGRWERPTKYEYVVHAEMFAILKAARWGIATEGRTLVAAWAACSNCAKHIVAAGIARLITCADSGGFDPAHWADSIALGDTILAEAGVDVVRVDGPFLGAPALLRNGRELQL